MRPTSPTRLALSWGIAGLVIASASAQQSTPPPPQGPTATFRAATKLVVQTVTVTDRDGRVVEGLTAADFAVTEDGVAQDLAFVEFQRVGGERLPEQTPPSIAVAPGQTVEIGRAHV